MTNLWNLGSHRKIIILSEFHVLQTSRYNIRQGSTSVQSNERGRVNNTKDSYILTATCSFFVSKVCELNFHAQRHFISQVVYIKKSFLQIFIAVEYADSWARKSFVWRVVQWLKLFPWFHTGYHRRGSIIYRNVREWRMKFSTQFSRRLICFDSVLEHLLILL